MPQLAVRALGLINPTMRALAEMAYEFDAPFILDTPKYQATFGQLALLCLTPSRQLSPGTGPARYDRPKAMATMPAPSDVRNGVRCEAAGLQARNKACAQTALARRRHPAGPATA